MARAQCGAQPRQIPLLDGLNLQVLWCLMFLLINSTLYLFYFALIFSVFHPPLRILVPFSVSLCLSSVVRLSIFMALTIRSLCLFGSSSTCRFTFCSCSWSSLFSVIMNAQGVATCPHLNHSSILRQFVSLVTLWIHSSSTVVVKWIPNIFKTWLNSLSILLLPSGTISSV